VETISGTTWSVEAARKCIKARMQVDEHGCWVWTRGLRRGYGSISVPIDRKEKFAHRVAYEAFVGAIPDGMCVCHKCDVPACVNPDHLFLGTNADNTADMVAKGRGWRPILRGETNGRAKLTADQVSEIRALYADRQGSCRSLGAKFGVSSRYISAIVRGENWGHV